WKAPGHAPPVPESRSERARRDAGGGRADDPRPSQEIRTADILSRQWPGGAPDHPLEDLRALLHDPRPGNRPGTGLRGADRPRAWRDDFRRQLTQRRRPVPDPPADRT